MLTDAQAYAQMQRQVNPYGDGKASERIVTAKTHYCKCGPLCDPRVDAARGMRSNSA
ncbi:MAG: hypothetical protein ACFB21_07380 [Opitutales bacterium]